MIKLFVQDIIFWLHFPQVIIRYLLERIFRIKIVFEVLCKFFMWPTRINAFCIMFVIRIYWIFTVQIKIIIQLNSFWRSYTYTSTIRKLCVKWPKKCFPNEKYIIMTYRLLMKDKIIELVILSIFVFYKIIIGN